MQMSIVVNFTTELNQSVRVRDTSVCVYVYVGVVRVCIDRSVHVYAGSIHMCVFVFM